METISYKIKNVKRTLEARFSESVTFRYLFWALFARFDVLLSHMCRDWEAKNSRFERQLCKKHGRISAGLCRTCENVASFDTGEVTKGKKEEKGEREIERDDGRAISKTGRHCRNFVIGNDHGATINHSHPSVRIKPGRATLAPSSSRPYQTRIRPPPSPLLLLLLLPVVPITLSKIRRAARVRWKESGDPREIGLPKKLPALSRRSIDPPPPTLNARMDLANVVAPVKVRNTIMSRRFPYIIQF